MPLPPQVSTPVVQVYTAARSPPTFPPSPQSFGRRDAMMGSGEGENWQVGAFGGFLGGSGGIRKELYPTQYRRNKVKKSSTAACIDKVLTGMLMVANCPKARSRLLWQSQADSPLAWVRCGNSSAQCPVWAQSTCPRWTSALALPVCSVA